MATSKATAAADTGTKAKTAETKAAASDDATTATTTEEKSAQNPADDTSGSTDGTAPAEGNSASDAVRARRASARDSAATDRVPTQVFDYGNKPRELTPEQVEAQNGLPTFHGGGPISSVTTLAGRHSIAAGKDSEYVIPDDDGFIAFVPDNCKTPSTIRVWSKGQAVKRAVHEHYTGLASSTASQAKVLDPQDVITVR